VFKWLTRNDGRRRIERAKRRVASPRASVFTEFAIVMPDYDRDAVYPSDMRKVFAWYQMLVDKNLLDFTVEENKPEGEAAEAQPEAKEE
jgi:hypothetical protein